MPGTIRGTTVVISTLANPNSIVEGYTFEDCRIVGPAVLVMVRNTTIGESRFDADPNGMFWENNAGQGVRITGAVGLQDCTFLRCTFQNIGIGGRPDELRRIRGEGFLPQR
jgi:hypothetical protein